MFSDCWEGDLSSIGLLWIVGISIGMLGDKLFNHLEYNILFHHLVPIKDTFSQKNQILQIKAQIVCSCLERDGGGNLWTASCAFLHETPQNLLQAYYL